MRAEPSWRMPWASLMLRGAPGRPPMATTMATTIEQRSACLQAKDDTHSVTEFSEPLLPLGQGETVFTQDGQRLGRIEEVNDEAFRIAATDQPGFWLRREAIDRTTPGGLVFLAASLGELDAWRWAPPKFPKRR
jgi:hypothetical protein